MTEFLGINQLAKGGLFDFGATLPLLMVQFTILTFVLNIILYSPLLNTIDERNNYIINILSKASKEIEAADELFKTNQNNIDIEHAKAQNNLVLSEKTYQQIWDLELQTIQSEFDSYVQKYTNYLFDEKKKVYKLLENEIDSLGVEIFRKMF
jgi:F-type H+-transporting ATPase subunit b